MDLMIYVVIFAAFVFEFAVSQFYFPTNSQYQNFNPRFQYQNYNNNPFLNAAFQPQSDFFFPNYNTPRPSANNNYRPQNSFGQPVNRPTARPNNVPTLAMTFTARPTPSYTSKPLDHRFIERISQKKCEEYASAIKKKVQVASLSLDSAPQDVQVTECETSTGLIVGGVDAKPGEFPHMAAIGYRDFNNQISFKCGGSLISEQFVLTAAHCQKADRTKPSLVRLGDQNLKLREPGMPEIDVNIDSFIPHELYNAQTRENDIALIKLASQLRFNKFMRPACLQQTDQISKKRVTATGWGYTEIAGPTSDILQKVDLNVLDNDKCKNLYDSEVYSSQLCAGILEGGKDTCGGDSGGPIQITLANDCVFSIVGITSYGSQYCGAKNSPGIYTRVSSYLDWIEQKVWA